MEQEEKTPKKTTSQSQRKTPLLQFFAGLGVFVLIAVLGVYIYAKGQVKQLSEAPFALQASTALRIPIAKIDGNPILYSEFTKDFLSLKRFYSNQPEGFPVPSENEIAEQVLSRLFINELIIEMAKDYGVELTDEDIATAKSELLSQFAEESEAAEEVQKTFGWSLETFTNRVIIPIVLEQKVAEAYEAQDSVEESYAAKQVRGSHILFIAEEGSEEGTRETAEGVLARIQDGEDFAELAKEFGSDGTAEVGGDLGWIDRGVTVPAFEEVLFSLEAGELHPTIVETQFGYHIVRADEVRTVNDFPLFFQDRLGESKIKIYADLNNPFDRAEEAPEADVTEEEMEALIEEELGQE